MLVEFHDTYLFSENMLCAQKLKKRISVCNNKEIASYQDDIICIRIFKNKTHTTHFFVNSKINLALLYEFIKLHTII